MRAISNNRCYYYLAKDEDANTFHLFTLFPVDQDTFIHLKPGVITKSSRNYICESSNEQQPGKGILLEAGGQKYIGHHEEIILDSEDDQLEIIIHGYAQEGGLFLYEETTILKEHASLMPENWKEKDVVAYNCPYIFLGKDKFISTPKKFFPRVLIPLKGYGMNLKNEVTIKNGTSTSDGLIAIFPLFKDGSRKAKMVSPEILNVNASDYKDEGEIEGDFFAATVLFEDEESSLEFSKKLQGADLETQRKLLKEKVFFRGQARNYVTDPVSNEVRSPKAKSLPASGVFIDKL